MTHVVPAGPVPVVSVVGTADTFPVRRIWCVGRNYAAHAREMGCDPAREPPFFFAKPADAVFDPARPVPYPPATSDYQHEVELVVALGSGGRDVDPRHASALVYGYAVGLDMTRRDLQASARKEGRPWDMAKGFDHSAPLGPIHPVGRVGHVVKGAITLSVNGAVRQRGDLADLTWSVAETLGHLSRLVELHPGDLVFTGTPEGVGPVVPGDVMVAHIDGLADLCVTVGGQA